MPAHVIFGEESFDDGVTITREEFYRRLKTSPKFCPPPPRPAPANLPKCINAWAARLSPFMWPPNGAACSTRRTRRHELVPEAQVTFWDSGRLAMGLGWQVILAARAAQQGQSLARDHASPGKTPNGACACLPRWTRWNICAAAGESMPSWRASANCCTSNPSSMSATAKSNMVDRVRTRHNGHRAPQRADVRSRPAAITGGAAYRQLRRRPRSSPTSSPRPSRICANPSSSAKPPPPSARTSAPMGWASPLSRPNSLIMGLHACTSNWDT